MNSCKTASCLFLSALTHQWGLLFFLVIICLTWVSHETLSRWLFSRHLRLLGFPQIRRGLFSFTARAAKVNDRRAIGAAWLFRQRQQWVVIVAIVVFYGAFFRAILTTQATELARGSALITVAGVLSLLFGIWESRALGKITDSLCKRAKDEESKAAIRQRMVKPIEGAEDVAARTSAYVSIFGTVAWAYGDQVMAAFVFPLRSIVDSSSVTCVHGCSLLWGT